jgi:hypothetical protein
MGKYVYIDRTSGVLGELEDLLILPEDVGGTADEFLSETDFIRWAKENSITEEGSLDLLIDLAIEIVK